MEILIDILPGLMFGSLVVGLFSGLPVAIVLAGITVIFAALAMLLGEMRFVQATLLPNRIYGGIVENQVLVAAPMFIFMGMLLEKSQIAEDLLITLQKLLRVVPGGLALAVVLMGTILAAATGIIGASVVMLTVMAVPTMLKRGYSPEFAAGTVASAGTLGILIPPSVMLVFMGDILTINLAKLFVAAFIPGLILALSYAVFIVFYAGIRPSIAPKAPPLEPHERKSLFRDSVLSFALPLILVIAVLGSILGGFASPTEAAGIGALAALLLGVARGRINIPTLGAAMDDSVRSLGMLFFIFTSATAFAYIFRMVGGEHFIVETARSLNMGDWGLLGMLLLMIFIMGFFFDWIEITLIMLPIVAPIVNLLDLDGHVAQGDLIYWFAVLMAVNLQTSFLTPPFGFALFYVKGAAGDMLSISQIYRGVIPFVILQLVVLGLLVWQPELVLWLPEKLLK